MREVRRSAFARRESLTVSAWADRYRQVAVGARKGQWRTDATPYLREIQDAIADPSLREVTIIKPTQLGGTEAIYNGLFYSIDQDPKDTLFVYPTDEDARFNNRKRFLPTVRRTPRIRRHLSVNKRDALAGEISFSRMIMRWVGSNSQSKLESYPWGKVFIDEVDRCEADTIPSVRERMKTFPEMMLVKVGSPEDAGVGIDREYNGAAASDDGEEGARDAGQAPSDQRRWMVPCPHCGVYHHRTFERVRWEGGRTANPMAVRMNAWMECPACSQKILAAANLWQSVRGRWCPRGMDVVALTAEQLGSDEIERGELTGTRPMTDHAGFAIGGLDSTLEPNPYGAVASKFVAAGCVWTKSLVNRTLGRAWVMRGQAVDLKDLRGRIKRVEDGGYGLGHVPKGVLALTAGIDVQQDGCWVEVLGWGAGGNECWLIEARYVKRTRGANLVELEALWNMRWAREGKPSGMGIVAAGVDSGRYTDEVYTAVRRWGAMIREPDFGTNGGVLRRVWPVKGEATNYGGQPWRVSTIEKRADRSASAIGEGLQLLLVNTDHWKEHVHARLRGPDKASNAGPEVTGGEELSGVEGVRGVEAGALEAVEVKPDAWHFAADTPGEYLAQLTAEECVITRAGGKVKRMWRLRPGRSRNHFLDCRVYSCAVADKEGVRKMMPEKVHEAEKVKEKAMPRRVREVREGGSARDRLAERRGGA